MSDEQREIGRQVVANIEAFERDPATSEWRHLLAQSTYEQLRDTQAALAASQADRTRVEAELHDALRRAYDLEQVREELRIAKLRNEGDLEDIQDLTSERDDLHAQRDEALAQFEEADRARDSLAAINAELRAEADELRRQLLARAEREQVLREEIADAMRSLTHAKNETQTLRADLRNALQELDCLAADWTTVQGDLAAAYEAQLVRIRTWQVARNDDAGDCLRCGRPIVRGQAVEPQPGTTQGTYSHVHCPEESNS